MNLISREEESNQNPRLVSGELVEAFEDWINVYRRGGSLHMVWLLACCKIYEMFEETCKDLIQMDRNDPLFNDLMTGFDHKILQTDREMFRFGVRARESGLEPLFQDTPDDEGLLSELMKAAQWSCPIDEEHPFYTENYGNALARYVTREIGKRFTKQGIIDDPQDLYYVLP